MFVRPAQSPKSEGRRVDGDPCLRLREQEPLVRKAIAHPCDAVVFPVYEASAESMRRPPTCAIAHRSSETMEHRTLEVASSLRVAGRRISDVGGPLASSVQ